MEEKEKVEGVPEDTRTEQKEAAPQSEIAKVLAYMERTKEEHAPTDEELEETPPQTAMQRIGGWCSNFWYHHKWATLITLFFVTVLAITIPQFLAKEDSDIQLMYGGPIRMDDVQLNAIEEAFEQMMWADLDLSDNGSLEATLMYQTIMTDAQIEEAEKNGSLILNRAELQDSKQLNMFLLTGEAIICLLDPTQYENIDTADGFVPLADLGITDLAYPVYDACGVRLKDTPFAKLFADAFAPLPDDTVLCIRRRTALSVFQSEKTEAARYAAHVSLFKNILTYSQAAD